MKSNPKKIESKNRTLIMRSTSCYLTFLLVFFNIVTVPMCLMDSKPTEFRSFAVK